MDNCHIFNYCDFIGATECDNIKTGVKTSVCIIALSNNLIKYERLNKNTSIVQLVNPIDSLTSCPLVSLLVPLYEGETFPSHAWNLANWPKFNLVPYNINGSLLPHVITLFGNIIDKLLATNNDRIQIHQIGQYEYNLFLDKIQYLKIGGTTQKVTIKWISCRGITECYLLVDNTPLVFYIRFFGYSYITRIENSSNVEFQKLIGNGLLLDTLGNPYTIGKEQGRQSLPRQGQGAEIPKFTARKQDWKQVRLCLARN